MLAGLWGKGDPSALLVGMETGEATMESSMDFPQKTRNGTALWPSIPLLESYPKNPETPIHKNLCTPMFIAAQFTIAKCWKQPSKQGDKKAVVYLHNRILCSRKKEGAPTVCNSMDGSRQHYAKWNKPGGKIEIPYEWNLINKQASKIQSDTLK